jgi:hypothetical protein
MFNGQSSPTLSNVTFSGNTARYDGGGGMYNWESSPTLSNVTFSGNSTANFGGGMKNYESSSPTLTNVTFSGNSASYGGGMCNDRSSPTLSNVTFSGNSAANYGGGMYNWESSPALTNCILWGNTAPSGPQICSNLTSSPSVTYSLVQGGYAAGTDVIDADPLFVRNPDPGDGDWGTPSDNDYGDLRLRRPGGQPPLHRRSPAGLRQWHDSHRHAPHRGPGGLRGGLLRDPATYRPHELCPLTWPGAGEPNQISDTDEH